MSPPIYTPDGSEVSEIVLPDGSTASEVIGPDGNVVFEAGPDIPDAGLLHNYDVSQFNGSDGDPISSLTDQTGSANVTQSTSSKQPIYKTNIINNLPVARFDRSSATRLSASYTSPQPITRFVVFQLRSTGQKQQIVDGKTANVNIFEDNISDDIILYAGQTLGRGGLPADTSKHLLIGHFDGSNSELVIDGSSIATGDVSANDPGGISLGAKNDDTEHADVDIGQVLEYDPTASGYAQSDVEDALSNIWGISI